MLKDAKEPYISIVMPIYNVGKYVRECLTSVYNQTMKNIEIIVIDDKSPDNSLEICQEFAQTHGNIKIIRNKENMGCSISRDTGIRHSRGKYIFVLDSDDMLYPNNMLEYMYNIAEAGQADVVHSPGFFRLDGEKLYPCMHEVPWNLDIKQPFFVTNNLTERMQLWAERKIFWNHWNKLILRKLIIDNNIQYVNDSGNDCFFCFQCCFFAKKYIRIPEFVYIYRLNPTSLSHTRNKNNLHKSIDFHMKTLKIFNDFMKNHTFFRENINVRKKITDLVVRGVAKSFAHGIWKYNPEAIKNGYMDEMESSFAEVYGEESALFIASMMRLCELHTRNLQNMTHWLE